MTEKSEALRLADALRDSVETDGEWSQEQVVAAAAELRRQHEENEGLRRERDEARRTVREAHEAGTRLTAQRDALLEACQTLVNLPEDWIATLRLLRVAVEQARAAIKSVEGE